MAHPRRIITPEERRTVLKLAAGGTCWQEIVREVGDSTRMIATVLREAGGKTPARELRDVSSHTTHFLRLEERQEIWIGLKSAESFRSVARRLGRAPATIWREVERNGGREGYQPFVAERRAECQARRPKVRKLVEGGALFARVRADLERLWSPEQITARLRLDFGDDRSMTVSHETIYQSVYVQGRGELRRELARCLRSGRAQRRPKGRMQTRGKFPGMVMISERPAEVADRAVPGHWEGDLIIGKDGRSAIGTLVERSTRFVMLLHLPKDRSAEEVCRAMAAKITTLPEALRRSITWDQGSEMAGHLAFSVETGVQIYFCDPHSPWQRGTNENTNGLLRQYFPKGTDLSVHSESDLDAAADSLNGRPRQTLGWMTPSEKLAQVLS